MDLEIRRRESTGSGANTHVETETLAKYELMDGAPVRGALNTFIFFLLPIAVKVAYLCYQTTNLLRLFFPRNNFY